MHADGGGLYLRVTKARSKQWVFIFQWAGKRSEMGLGGLNDVTLAEARDSAAAARLAVRRGQNPITARRTVSSPADTTGDTFGEFSMTVVDGLKAGWKNDKHKAQWRSSLSIHCAPIWDVPVGAVKTEDVTACLTPIWLRLPETADRVRGRLERVLDAAVVMGKRDADLANPARWKGHLKMILPARPKHRQKHHKAMPWEELPEFMVDLAGREALAARALELLILCCTRTTECLCAHASEFDLTKAEWTIPGERMKAGVAHTIPLVGRALEIVKELLATRSNSGLLFPGAGKDGTLSNMSMEMLLRRMTASPRRRPSSRSTSSLNWSRTDAGIGRRSWSGASGIGPACGSPTSRRGSRARAMMAVARITSRCGRISTKGCGGGLRADRHRVRYAWGGIPPEWK